MAECACHACPACRPYQPGWGYWLALLIAVGYAYWAHMDALVARTDQVQACQDAGQQGMQMAWTEAWGQIFPLLEPPEVLPPPPSPPAEFPRPRRWGRLPRGLPREAEHGS